MRFSILLLFAIGVVGSVVGSVVIVKNHMANRAEYRELVEHGQRATASVVSRERTSDTSLSSRGRRTQSEGYFVTYRYDGKAGSHGRFSFSAALRGQEQDADLDFQYLTFRVSVSRARYEAAGRGERADIIFLPERPEVVRFIDENGDFKRRSGVPWAILALMFAALCGKLFHQYRTTGTTW